ASVKPGQIATLILPQDCQMAAASGPGRVRQIAPPPRVGEEAIEQAAMALGGDESVALLLGGYGLRERGLKAAGRIASVSGCKLMCETFPARWERGVGTPIIERLPYFPEAGIAALSPYKTVILAGTRSPVSFFGYPGVPSYLISAEQRALT